MLEGQGGLQVCHGLSKSPGCHYPYQNDMSWGLDPFITMRVRRNLSIHLTATNLSDDVGFWPVGHGSHPQGTTIHALVAGGEMWSLSLYGENHDSAVQVGDM